MRAFALREGLNPYTLWSWKRRLRGTTPAPPAFATVVVGPTQESRSGAFELTVQGMSLRIPADFDEASLARLVSLLGRT